MIKTPQVIALIGHAGSGKDTVANILIEKYGYTKLSFAAKLKDAVAIVYDVDRALLEGDTDESRKFRETPCTNMGGKTPRQVMQQFGTEVGRSVYAKTWVDAVTRQIDANPEQQFVITDCRFENELAAIAALPNARVWAINRYTVDPKWHQFLLSIVGYKPMHVSELNLPKLKALYADANIDNDCTLSMLKFDVSLRLFL